MTRQTPGWLSGGRGISPRLGWSWSTDASLVGFALARETGEVFAADFSGDLYRLDRAGKIAGLTRGLKGIRALVWSDTGEAGAALLGDACMCRLTRDLKAAWTFDFPEPTVAAAVDPYGQNTAVSLADGGNLVLNNEQKQVSVFETQRPLSQLRFVTTQTDLVGAAEYGLLCCYQLDGSHKWSERLWSNIGDLSVTGDGERLFLAGFNVGIQTYDGKGNHRGSYVVEGTVNHVATSFTGDRLVATTVEGHLYWLDADGSLIWATAVDEEICQVACDPLGEWIVCGFSQGRLVRLDW